MRVPFDDLRKIAFRALDAGGAAPGMDEEGGWACAWLEAAGLDGLKLLLEAFDTIPPEHRGQGLNPTTITTQGELDCEGHSACFIGVSIVDFAVALGAPMTVKNLNQPAFLLPFLHRAQWHVDNFVAINATIIRPGFSKTDHDAVIQQNILAGIPVDRAAYERVYALSRAILVPETEQSRLTGAGAGLTDND